VSGSESIVHVVDDDQMFRDALANMLRVAGYTVRAYTSAGEFLLATHARTKPGCIVLDVNMPGPSGLALHEALAGREDPLPVIFLTGYGDIPTTVRAMKTGAIDFLTKPVQRNVLLAAIESALARDAAARSARERQADLQERFRQLTGREAVVFHGIVAGKLNRQIGDELRIAERTVKTYRSQVMSKMRAASVAELVALASELAAADPPRSAPGSEA
jgi:FixJ family two-component response regulator